MVRVMVTYVLNNLHTRCRDLCSSKLLPSWPQRHPQRLRRTSFLPRFLSESSGWCLKCGWCFLFDLDDDDCLELKAICYGRSLGWFGVDHCRPPMPRLRQQCLYFLQKFFFFLGRIRYLFWTDQPEGMAQQGGMKWLPPWAQYPKKKDVEGRSHHNKWREISVISL